MTDDDEARLQTRRDLLQGGFSAGDLDALGRLVTDDVVWVAAGQSPWLGRSEVLTRLGGFFEQFDYQFRLDATHLTSDGRRAVERSTFVSRVVAEAGPVGPTHEGSVVIIWVRADEWRVAAYLDLGGPLFA